MDGPAERTKIFRRARYGIDVSGTILGNCDWIVVFREQGSSCIEQP